MRRFASSGRVRLNANGRKLDAWLIYKCEVCEATWNLPLLERAEVGSVARADLQAMQRSDAAWVQAREFDPGLIGRYCGRVDLASDVRVTKTLEGEWAEAWSEVALVVEAALAAGQRLDRLLALELGVTRSALQGVVETGGVVVDAGALRKPVRGRVTVRFVAAALREDQRVAVRRGVTCGGGVRLT